MRVAAMFLVAVVCAVSAYSQRTAGTATNDPANTLPIKRVILYSNGVAYFERRGIVDGDVQIDLSFRESQVDDVLKSMIVLDLGQGKIGSVSYNSSMPASARTAEIPFSVDAMTQNSGGIAEVLSQMQGAKVSIATARGPAIGRILTIHEQKTEGKPDVPASIERTIVIASDTGEISGYVLSDIRGVKLLDDGMRKNVDEFANAVASSRRRDAKTITITGSGTGPREMVVSYTVAAPIWKTTYRVVLDPEGKPFFQGWAIIDNVSDEDWNDVQLSLISGSPVSFIQNLQKPLYRYRPIIPIPEDLNLRPQIYDPEAGSGGGVGYGTGSGYGSGSGSGDGAGFAPPAPPKAAFDDANSNFIVSSGFSGTSVSDSLVAQTGGIDTAASGAEIGDLFEYKIEQPVSVPRNRSALIPIIQTKMDGERVSIFRLPAEDDEDASDDEYAAARKANPRAMSGLLLKNITPMTFEGGSMTVLDGDAYAGEALMERLKPNEQRLISFALDLGTHIRTEKTADRDPAKIVKVVDGAFQIHYFKTDKRVYHLSNQTDRPKAVYIEHPRRKDWVLSDSFAKPDYTTARFYRFRVELKPYETKELTVGENFGMMDAYQLNRLSPKDLDLFVRGRYIDDTMRARLGRFIDLRMRINDISAKLSAIEKESGEIAADQERLRENIESLVKTSGAKQLIARYISKADTQESRLEQIRAERTALNAEKIELERQLAIEIKNFEVQ